LQNFARKECGFDGYFLTDMASGNGAAYMTYDDGIFNGTDLFLGNGSASSLDAWKDNPAYAQRMREACHRVLYVIANYSCAMNGLSSASHVVAVTPSWQKLLKGLTIGSGVLFGLSAAALACCYFVKKKGD
jgi:beta-glucosidase